MSENTSEKDEFLVTWHEDDPESPMNWSTTKKWTIIGFLCIVEILVSALSAAYSSGIKTIESDYGLSEQVALLGQSLFVIGLAIAPLFLGPLSEIYGRQPVYIGSLFVIVLFQIPSAYNHNAQTLLVARFFSGCAASVPLTNTGGSVADMFERQSAGYAISLFAAAGVSGPAFGPLIAGYIYVTKSWQWIFWVFMILLGTCLVIQLFVPETKHNILLKRRAKKLRQEDSRYHAEGEDDVHPVKLVKTLLRESFWMLVTEPIILTLGLYNAYDYGILYIFFESYPLVFGETHGFNEGEVGLAFLGIIVGTLLSLMIHPIFERRYRERGNPQPEYRVEGSIYTAILLPLSLFWFAWTSKSQTSFLSPIFASVPFGIAAFYIYYGVVNFVTDAYGPNASSGLAAISFVRSSFGAGFTHIAPPMYSYLGYTWATATLGFISIPLIFIPFIIWKYGAQLRERSPKAI